MAVYFAPQSDNRGLSDILGIAGAVMQYKDYRRRKAEDLIQQGYLTGNESQIKEGTKMLGGKYKTPDYTPMVDTILGKVSTPEQQIERAGKLAADYYETSLRPEQRAYKVDDDSNLSTTELGAGIVESQWPEVLPAASRIEMIPKKSKDVTTEKDIRQALGAFDVRKGAVERRQELLKGMAAGDPEESGQYLYGNYQKDMKNTKSDIERFKLASDYYKLQATVEKRYHPSYRVADEYYKGDMLLFANAIKGAGGSKGDSRLYWATNKDGKKFLIKGYDKAVALVGTDNITPATGETKDQALKNLDVMIKKGEAAGEDVFILKWRRALLLGQASEMIQKGIENATDPFGLLRKNKDFNATKNIAAEDKSYW